MARKASVAWTRLEAGPSKSPVVRVAEGPANAEPVHPLATAPYPARKLSANQPAKARSNAPSGTSPTKTTCHPIGPCAP